MPSVTAPRWSSAASWNISKRPASTPVTRPVPCRPIPSRAELIDEIRRQTELMALELNVKGLMNVQFAVKDDDIYILEVNPRAHEPSPLSPRPPVARWQRSPPGSWPARRSRSWGSWTRSEPKHICGQGIGLPLRQVPRRRYHSRAGDEINRRGHGDRRHLCQGLCQGATGCRRQAAPLGQGLHQRADSDKKHLVSRCEKAV